MTEHELTHLVVPKAAVTWDEIGGEIVAINLANGHYHSLRETARDAFVLFAAGVSVPDVVAALAATGPSADEVAADVGRFVTDLVAAGLVVDAGTPGGDTPVGDGPDVATRFDGSRAYGAPMLETYTDLEDLMLLDPVHDVDDRGWPRADLGA